MRQWQELTSQHLSCICFTPRYPSWTSVLIRTNFFFCQTAHSHVSIWAESRFAFAFLHDPRYGINGAVRGHRRDIFPQPYGHGRRKRRCPSLQGCRVCGGPRCRPDARGGNCCGLPGKCRLSRECYGEDFHLKDICPLNTVDKEPFITRCCQKKRTGPATVNGFSGAVVHFGASPPAIYAAILKLATTWRSKCHR